jgi:hypothetical protein
VTDQSDQDRFHELAFYTLAHGDPAFIHQLAVDAFGAQCASVATKPVTITMALVGLYLHNERGMTGRAVQDAHVSLAKTGPPWPRFPLPASRGAVRVNDVLAAPAGSERDAMIELWNAAVWDAYHARQPQIEALLVARRRPGARF